MTELIRSFQKNLFFKSQEFPLNIKTLVRVQSFQLEAHFFQKYIYKKISLYQNKIFRQNKVIFDEIRSKYPHQTQTETLKIHTKFNKTRNKMSRVEILKDCRYYLKKFHMSNDDHVRFFNIPIPQIVANFAWLSPMVITSSCLMRFCIINGFDLNTVSSAFAMVMGTSQLGFIYISLAVNRRVILETINEMQHVVDYRKFLCWKKLFFVVIVKKIWNFMVLTPWRIRLFTESEI